MIVEPDVIHKKHLFLARIFQSRFHRSPYKKNTEIIQRCNNAIFFIYGASQIQHIESLEVSKTENCSLIASARNKLQGHQLRHEIVLKRYVSGALVCQFWVVDTSLLVQRKMVWSRFMYSVVIENSREAGYFTEKIVDCLSLSYSANLLGCPGYW